MANLATDLHYTFEVRDVRFCSGIELLLWELFLGGVAAKVGNSPHLRTFFLERVWTVSNTLALRRWEEVEKVLDGIFWLKESLRHECKEVWQEAWHDDTRKILPTERAAFSMCGYGL